MAVVARLEHGLDEGWIPGWLKVRIACNHLTPLLANLSQNALETDTGIGFQRFKPAAFSKTATSDLSDPVLDVAIRDQLEYTPRKVRKIFKNAFYCQTKGRDENAWSN